MTDATDLAGPPDEGTPLPQQEGVRRGLSRRRRIALIAGTAGLVVLAGLWTARTTIATRVIDSNLAALDLPARYEIESIGPGLEVLRHVVVGDPRRPDLTIDRLELRPAYDLGGPRIGRLRVEGVRLFGRQTGNTISFGALDKVLYATPTDPATPFRLPDWRLDLVDARGVVDSAQGRVAFKAEGQGALRSGFAGTLALLMPESRFGSCVTGQASLFARVTTAGERPRLDGPLRLSGMRCDTAGLNLPDVQARLIVTADRDLGGLVVDAKAMAARPVLGTTRAAGLTFDAGLAWRDAKLSGRIALRADQVRQPQLSLAALGVDAMVQARAGFSTMQVRGTVSGEDLRHGPSIDRALASAAQASAGTLLAPLLAQLRTGLGREEAGSRLAGEFLWKADAAPGGAGWSLSIPDLGLRGHSGQRLLAASRLHLAAGAKVPLRLDGEFATGGPGLPQIFGRVDHDPSSGTALVRARLEPFGTGSDRISLPQLTLRPGRDGGVLVAGTLLATGAIPGGTVGNLAVPFDASLARDGRLAAWSHCFAPSFDRLSLGTLSLEAQRLTVCPTASGAAVARQDGAGWRLAGTVPAFALKGRLGSDPLALSGAALTFSQGGAAGAGRLSARQINAQLGSGTDANTVRLATVDAQLAGQAGGVLAGQFGGLQVQAAALPADLSNGSGQWHFVQGRLMVSDAALDVTDRQKVARFEPLHAKGVSLLYADNRVEALAPLFAPKTGQELARVTVRHDLDTGTGHADIAVAALKFEDRKDNSGLQPADLTKLALGVVANASGTITGRGRVDWQGGKVTSSGRFGTTSLDLAAAFGPVKGVSGTLDFTDLIGLVTAPHQVLKVAAINPGIEANDGTIDLQLLPDQVVRLNGAYWPFLGGKLSLDPAELHLAQSEVRRFTLVIDGLDAAKFLDRMELSNLAATGSFDGRLPLEFDGDINGYRGRIVGGNLVSRAPGGTVAYVGALTYKDLSPMANYAFAALKSMDYRTMVVTMQGDLAGEIVTNVKFGGIKQGNAASKNFVTRQIAGLPIQFNINVRAPFLQLITSVKAMYDPAAVRDPRTLGLVDAQGRALRKARGASAAAGAVQPASLSPARTVPPAGAGVGIQPSVIGSRP